jgi:hypothetical protein
MVYFAARNFKSKNLQKINLFSLTIKRDMQFATGSGYARRLSWSKN